MAGMRRSARRYAILRRAALGRGSLRVTDFVWGKPREPERALARGERGLRVGFAGGRADAQPPAGGSCQRRPAAQQGAVLRRDVRVARAG